MLARGFASTAQPDRTRTCPRVLNPLPLFPWLSSHATLKLAGSRPSQALLLGRGARGCSFFFGSHTPSPPLIVHRSSVRAAHSFDVPDFGYQKAPEDPTLNGDITRRAFTYLVVGAAGVTYAAGAKVAVRDFVNSMNASADVLAMANVEINVGEIPEGTGVTVKVARGRASRGGGRNLLTEGAVARQAPFYSPPRAERD